MWEWSRGVMVRGRVVEIGGLIDREFQTLRSTVELGSRYFIIEQITLSFYNFRRCLWCVLNG